MNPVNATSLYVSASRSVLQCDPRDPRALAELCKLLPFFRQSLSCLVCGELLQDPIAPTDSSCQHYVCRGCRGRRMQLRPSCSWCKDYSRFQENRQLSLLVRCYRKLCLYIAQSPLAAHIARAAGDSPELRAILNEGLTLAEGEPEPEAEDAAAGPDSASGAVHAAAAAAPAEEPKAEEPSPVGVNGLHECNGLVDADAPQHAVDAGGGAVKQEDFSEEALGEVGLCDMGLCDITSFADDLKHGGGGGPLLLSVEEVLRTLETEPEPRPNGPRCLPDSSPSPPQPPPQPSAAVPRAPPRHHRKRSRSESDSEKLQPLPIATLLRGPAPLAANGSSHRPNPGAAARQEPKFPAAGPHPPRSAPVPNGGPPKVGKTVLIPNKALKKTVEHHGGPKKAYAKARQATPKPRPQPRDRMPPHPHPHPHPLTHPPCPSKPLYKKPVEKKGCKCGRATQNPSVLTCRGQRCPCYSNRKACLDCICRGCQNSYMANGEKKLEAFAVPEKALEQTRLTLGINLTSIAAAALRGPAAGSPGGGGGGAGGGLLNVTTATGAPVTAAFLSGAGHEGRGFDDSLEMRFDC